MKRKVRRKPRVKKKPKITRKSILGIHKKI